ncbi:prephenate dehydrogenase/arogenate dehydrogenase family protein [Bifidobacterium eulemuris]|uniref:Prephenate dehydrogenase/arogenate dehydrogenase family protein n=1 Tax=Bifidobacterium eulemuris TaxID=1765219 RepID=A0A7L9SSW9_9BIFI|nr:prephenate dehydrogenase/arogenate dehydrogenase family protein [Bifidobacterium eulemuris]
MEHRAPSADTPSVIGVVGLGLIGGSLARRLVDRGRTVVAWNHRPHPYEQARHDGIICEDSLAGLVGANPDVVVLCNPLKAMPAILAELKPLLDACPNVTLTDVGSVKGMVREQVEAAGLGNRYVGAHPMAGNERSGWSAADPHLYDDALWAITVDANTAYDRFLTVARFVVDAVGDQAIVLDDDTHDRAAALISHMPHAVATALINELVGDPIRNIAAALAAGSWRDMTRVALTDPLRTRAMIEEDAANVETLLRHMAARLNAVADQLHDGDADALTEFFAAGQPFRDYKAAVNAQTTMGEAAANHTDADTTRLSIPHDGWQQALLASAARGEHIVAIDGEYEARVAIRSRLERYESDTDVTGGDSDVRERV